MKSPAKTEPRRDVAQLLAHAHAASLVGDGGVAMTALYDAYTIAAKAGLRPVAADALYRLARQALMNNDSSASLHFAELIFELAGKNDNSILFKGYLAVGHHFANAGRDADVLSILRDAGVRCSAASLAEFCDYLALRGCAETMRGKKSESISNFDLAIEISAAQDSVDAYSIKVLDAAINAPAVGLIPRARLLHERATLLATENRLGYIVPICHLMHARTCLIAGDLSEARKLLEIAELSPSNHFYVRLYRVVVGVLLGSLIDEDDLVQSCLDMGALELAFKSSAPQRIGPISAAIHEHYIRTGRNDAAANLLTRALNSVSTPDDCWWLLLQAASHGSAQDAVRGLEILRPYKDDFELASAHRLLLQARVARLTASEGSGRSDASRAATIFATLGWKYHHATALRLASRNSEANREFLRIGARTRIRGYSRGQCVFSRRTTRRTTLRPKEREIALLVARGATNRRIAQRLQIAERSVKYHLTMIYTVLGVENRAALADLVNGNPNFAPTS